MLKFSFEDWSFFHFLRIHFSLFTYTLFLHLLRFLGTGFSYFGLNIYKLGWCNFRVLTLLSLGEECPFCFRIWALRLTTSLQCLITRNSHTDKWFMLPSIWPSFWFLFHFQHSEHKLRNGIYNWIWFDFQHSGDRLWNGNYNLILVWFLTFMR